MFPVEGKDCEFTFGEVCDTPSGDVGAPLCTPMEVVDCPPDGPEVVHTSVDLWTVVVSWVPLALAVLFLLVAVGLLVWLLIEMSRRRADQAKLRAAFAGAEGWKASAHAAAANNRGAITKDLLDQLVVLSDFPQSAGAGEQLEQVLAAAGIVRFTVNVGDPFDENVHMARVRRETTDPAQNRTVAEVIRPGFRTADRIIRPADVAVWMSS